MRKSSRDGRTSVVPNRSLDGVRVLETMAAQDSKRRAMLRAFGYAGVLIVSFFIALWLIDRHNDEHSPLLGTVVIYEITAEKQPEVCATAKSVIQFRGQICEVNGDTLSVVWNSLANTTNSQPSCGSEKVVRWYRKDGDPAYNARFLGSCGVGPQYFKTMPSSFGPNSLRASTDQ
jgi:hypothetical protein